MKDYHYILGVSENCTPEEIKQAYRKLSHKFHPDKNPGDPFFERRFREVKEAYEYLSSGYARQESAAETPPSPTDTNSSIGIFFRWIAFVPAAILAASFAAGLADGIGQWLFSGWTFPSAVVIYVSAFFFVVFWMTVGMQVAPVKNTTAKAILITPLVLLSLGWIFLSFWVFSAPEEFVAAVQPEPISPSVTMAWEVYLLTFGMVIGTWSALVKSPEEIAAGEIGD